MTDVLPNQPQLNPVQNPEAVELSQLDTQDTLAQTVLFMDKIHAEETLSTPEAAKQFLDNMTYEEFHGLTDRINGLARGVHKAERGMWGDAHVREEGWFGMVGVVYRPPAERNRQPLMREAFEAAKAIQDPAQAGLMLGFAINSIHAYPDGNGRTARFVYGMLSHGYDGSPEDKDYFSRMLENTTGRDVIDPNPATHKVDQLIRSDLRDVLLAREESPGQIRIEDMGEVYGGNLPDEYDPESLVVSAEITDKERKSIHNVMRDGKFLDIVLMKTFDKSRLTPFITQEKDGVSDMDGGRFVASLSSEEIKKLRKAANNVKLSYVHRLLKIAERPDIDEIMKQYTPKSPDEYGKIALAA